LPDGELQSALVVSANVEMRLQTIREESRIATAELAEVATVSPELHLPAAKLLGVQRRPQRIRSMAGSWMLECCDSRSASHLGEIGGEAVPRPIYAGRESRKTDLTVCKSAGPHFYSARICAAPTFPWRICATRRLFRPNLCNAKSAGAELRGRKLDGRAFI